MSSFRFRRKTDYALMMISILATEKPGTIVPLSKMEEYGLPKSYLVKIARELIKADLVIAKEGRGGGYMLTREATSASLKDVVEAVEGKVGTVDCIIHGDRECPLAGKCRHRGIMGKLSGEIGELLSKYKLSELEK